MFENVLAAYFVDFCWEHSYFSVEFRIFACIGLSCKECLQVSVLFSEVIHVLFSCFMLLSGCLIELLSEIEIQIDKFSSVIFELVESSVNSVFWVGKFVVEFFHPFCQNAQNRGVVCFKLASLYFFLAELFGACGNFMTNGIFFGLCFFLSVFFLFLLLFFEGKLVSKIEGEPY